MQFVGLAFQCLPIFLLFLHRKYFELSFLHFLLISLIFTFVIQSFEITLSSTGLQFILSVACAVVLITPITHSWKDYFGYSIIALSCLTGVPSVLIAPFFLYTFIRERSSQKFIQLILITIGAFTQLFYIINYSALGNRTIQESMDTGFILSALAVKLVLIPLGLVGFVDLSGWSKLLAGGELSNGVFLAIAFLILLIAFLNISRDRLKSNFLIGAAILMSIISIIGSLGSSVLVSEFLGSRYFYAPSLLIALSVILKISNHSRKHYLLGLGCLFISGWFVVAGIISGPAIAPAWRGQVPSWSQQLEKLRSNQTPFIRISPAFWVIGYPLEIVNDYTKLGTYKTALALSNGRKFLQKFTCKEGSVDGIYLTVVTFGKQVTAYDVSYRFMTVRGDKYLTIREGILNSSAGTDWGQILIDLGSRQHCGDDFVLELYSNDSPEKPLGLPIYSMSSLSGKENFFPVLVNGKAPLKEMPGLGIKTTLSTGKALSLFRHR